jgi:hypothetical protein
MPEQRPGTILAIPSATRAVNHGAVTVEPNTATGIPGVAVKTAAAPAGTGLGAAAINQIQVGEQFNLIVKGKVYIDNPGGVFTRFQAVYVTGTTGVLTATAAGNVLLGRVTEIAGDRGVGTGKMRVDLDLKSSVIY